MTLPSEPIRVVVICDPGPIYDQLVAAINSQQDFQLAEALNNPERLVRDLRTAEPDILVIDHQLNGQSTLDILEDLVLQFPSLPVIAMLPTEDPIRAQQVMLAGARGFIYQPFTQINLLNTLARVADLTARQKRSSQDKPLAAEAASRPVRIVAVYSPRGGVGCSTLAANLALSLMEETEQQVLLLEGKLFFGHLDVLLNIRPQYTIADLVPHANNLDPSIIHEVIMRHVSGLHVLLSPGNIQVAQGIHPDALYNILQGIQGLYDHVVIDAGSQFNENTITLLDAADRILLVTNPDLASLHDASRFIQVSRSLAYPTDKVLLVLNRTKMPGGVKSQDIESAMHQQLFMQIPSDDANALRSINRGIPLILRYPNSPTSRAIKNMAKGLLALHNQQAGKSVNPIPEKAKQDLLLASSRLG